MQHLIKIGDFSRLGRVSVVTLRHYDALGLLPAAHVDAENGYRYYTIEQLPRLRRILALKELGFSLDQIVSLLSDDLPIQQLYGMLQLRRVELERQVRAEQARLAAVEARLGQIEREGAGSAYDIVMRSVPNLLVASIRDVVPEAERIEQLFEEAEAFAAARNIRASAPPVAVYYDAEYRESDIDLEVAVPITHVVAAHGRVLVHELPAVCDMACVVHSGSYATLDAASSALYTWIASQGYRVVGAYREVYLRFGVGGLTLALPGAYLAQEAADYLTELQLPVERE